MALEKYRQLTKGGGLTIPRLLRQEMGVHPGDPLEISVNTDGALVISKHRPSCHICGSTKYIATYKGLCLCRGCHIKMGEALDDA